MKLREKMKRFWTLDVHNHAGFTLVELIIVIAILAILSTGAIAGYSAYVEKAKASADLNLLSAYNTAFTSACAINGVPMDAVEGTEILLQGEEGSKTYNGISVAIISDKMTRSSNAYADLKASIAADFETYLGTENRTIAFKVYVQIVFQDGAFVGKTADEATVTIKTESGISVTLKKEDAEKFVQSVYGTDMESAELLGKVDLVTGVAAQMMIDKDGNISQLFASPNYQNAFANALGLEGEALGAKNHELVLKKLLADNPDFDVNMDGLMSSPEYQEAQAAIIANNAVLFAAQNTPAAAEGIMDILAQDGTTKVTIAGNLMVDETNDIGLAQAAIAYGMYTAYAERYGKTVPSDPVDVLTLLDTDADFKAYIKGEKIGENSTAGQADQDLAGYLAAMNMINDNTGNSALVEDVLVNGFNTADLEELLNKAKEQ